ncbi:Alpha-1,6-mannosyl-glycoprotein 2-beta-N-acetylglucosaminyltransferase [Orchesella cincta]|uniref:Alpha-1,6-mannosyl-glycoprotein 2-beta-N-acetylglucosaminyltransferase n=1 Tax=Orchesella cincta TaxID=48709 RepID=A0A1D2MEW3_ORCCI|nr:Alpha-1,6-mannosyl-glycoprotein 2-beta-N-acetylglucosaminyltransferase [Orchesella cincta]
MKANHVERLKILDIENALKAGNDGGGGNGASSAGGSTGNGGGEHGRLGTPAFINLPEASPLTPDEIEEISKEIRVLNAEQKIYNLEKYGAVNENTYVLVIQVHSRVEYLSLLVDSLSRMQNIENSLIIFSHDLYLPGLNEAIRNIDFARIMQIFYPNSIQLNPNRFPGQSPDDCPRDITPTKESRKCMMTSRCMADYLYANENSLVWKATSCAGNLRFFSRLHDTGVIAFLEEDHYVTPDFLWMLNLMETAMMRNLCHGCNLLSLGTYLKTWNIRSSHSRAVVTNWISSKHNMAISFNKTLWEKLRKCAPTFCEYDDYNWDWSLLQVSYTCLQAQLDVLGVHHKKKTCDPKKAAQAIEKGIKQYSSLLFPDNLTVELRRGKKMRLKKGNGGWGDLRDKQLCMSFAD